MGDFLAFVYMANTRRGRGGRRTRRRTAARRGGIGGYDVSPMGVMGGRKTATRKVAGGKRREMRRGSRARRGGIPPRARPHGAALL